MRQVSKEQFFKRIEAEKLDVHPRIVTDKHPYTSDWEFHRQFGRPLYGRTVGRIERGVTTTDYFIAA